MRGDKNVMYANILLLKIRVGLLKRVVRGAGAAADGQNVLVISCQLNINKCYNSVITMIKWKNFFFYYQI